MDDETHLLASSVFDEAPTPASLHESKILKSPLILLIIIGAFSGIAGLVLDFWLGIISHYHNTLLSLGFGYFLGSALVAVILATILVHAYSPHAAGSGLPQMKVALSGVDMSPYLTIRCVFVKAIGLLLAFAASLSIGKEGPLIVIVCGIAAQLLKFAPFQRTNLDSARRLEVLACACAAGVAATFGSPFGGVLFGVEVTSYFYMVRTLPRSLLASIAGSLLVHLTTDPRRSLFLFGQLTPSSSNADSGNQPREILTFTEHFTVLVFGISCGVGASLFNVAVSKLVSLRVTFLRHDHESSEFSDKNQQITYIWYEGLSKRLILVITATFLCCFAEFYGDSSWFIRQGSPRDILETLFTPTSVLPSGPESMYSLRVFLVLKVLLTLVSVILPVPCGIFTPMFAIGGIYGRLVGETIQYLLGGKASISIAPFEFALIGAGAFVSGTTETVSTAVIIMELSPNNGLHLPLSLAIIASYVTSKTLKWSESIYDVMIAHSNLPRLRRLPSKLCGLTAGGVMQHINKVAVLTANSTYRDAVELLQEVSHHEDQVIPIVASLETMAFVAVVTRDRIITAIDAARESSKIVLSPKGRKFGSSNRLVRRLSAIGESTLSMLSPFSPYGTFEATGRELDPLPFAMLRDGAYIDWGSGAKIPDSKWSSALIIHPSPLQLMEESTLQQVDLLFRMLKMPCVFVTRQGTLVGKISRVRLQELIVAQ